MYEIIGIVLCTFVKKKKLPENPIGSRSQVGKFLDLYENLHGIRNW